MQKITIQYLGPIKKLEMELKDFHLLIGEQATGKSTIAKGIYFVRSIKSVITDYLCQLYDTGLYNGKSVNTPFYKTLNDELTRLFISLFGYSWGLNKNLYMKYEYTESIWIEVTLGGNKKYISVTYSPELAAKIKALQKEVLELHAEPMEISATLAFTSKERTRNYDDITNRVNRIFSDYKETYYIPAGRSMMTLLANSRSVIKNENDNVNLDLITKRFMLQIDSIDGAYTEGIRGVHKRFPGSEARVDVKKISDMLIEFLKGDFWYDKGRQYFVINGNERIPINFVSSGQQEVLWLLNQLHILLLKSESAFVIIEEPEAHLYPTLQKDVMEFISYFVNMTHSTVFITTHSPYVLTCVNTLYCAGKKMQESAQHQKEVKEIVGEKKEILPSAFLAYKIDPNGEFEDLIDKEMQEINADLIDEVSDEINEKYVDLLFVNSDRTNEGGR